MDLMLKNLYNAPFLRKLLRIIPVVFLALLFLWKQMVTIETNWIEFFEILSYSLVVVGYLIRFWANGYRKSLKKVSRSTGGWFVNCGPYAYVRHPLYLGNIIIILGVLISSFSPTLILSGGIITIVTFFIIARMEEKYLLSTYGVSYEMYIKNLPRFIPKLRLHTPSDKLPFHFKYGFRDLKKMVYILSFFIVCDVLVEYFPFRQIFIEPTLNVQRDISRHINTIPGKETWNFAFIGDTRKNTQQVNKIAGHLADLKKQDKVDAVFTLGDNLIGMKSSKKVMEKLFIKPMEPLLSLNVPVFGCLGNHDRFHRKYEVNSPVLNMHGCNYYQVTFGDNVVTFFVLDSETLTSFFGDKQQMKWLTEALENCQARWKIVLLHTPIISSKVSHGPDKSLYNVLSPILHGKVDFVFAGHNHIYERLKPVDGINYFIVGGSGALDQQEFTPDEKSIITYNKKQFFFWFEIKENLFNFQTINMDGEIVDSGSYPKS